jgi:lysophospholipase L1-like esterase
MKETEAQRTIGIARASRAASALAFAWLIGSSVGCGGGGQDGRRAVALDATAVTWAVLGSSTAAGTGATNGEGWVALLAVEQQPRGAALVNLARPGLLSSQAVAVGTAIAAGRAQPDPAVNIDRALALSAKVVILSFPSNDSAAGVPAAETVAHWQSIQQSAAQAGAVTLVLSTQPRDNLDAAQRATQDDTDRLAAAAFGPCFIATRAALSDAQGNIAAALSAGDGIHLNADGHRVIFERVNSVLDGGRCVRAAP